MAVRSDCIDLFVALAGSAITADKLSVFKLALENEDLFNRLSKHPILRRFVVFRIDCLPNLRDPILASRLYEKLYTGDGISKQTAPGRFRDLDSMAADFLTHESNSIHDVAVSSGVTSLELYAVLRDRGIPFKLMVSDKFSHYLYRGTMMRRIYTVNKTLLCVYVLEDFLADRKCSWKFPISKILFPLVWAFDKPSSPFGEIPLYDFRLLELIREGHVEDLSYDIFSTSMPGRFTFVRCMNVLNPGYFKSDAICRALSLLKNSLKDQGILLLGRTMPDGANAVSFYKKVSGHLELIEILTGEAKSGIWWKVSARLRAACGISPFT